MILIHYGGNRTPLTFQIALATSNEEDKCLCTLEFSFVTHFFDSFSNIHSIKKQNWQNELITNQNYVK